MDPRDVAEAKAFWERESLAGDPTWEELAPKHQREFVKSPYRGATQVKILAEHQGELHVADGDETSDIEQHYLRNNSIVAALEELADSKTASKIQRGLAKRLSEVFAAGIELPISIEKEVKFNGKRVAGVTGVDGDWIQLDGTYGVTSRTVLLHEALHAATVAAMRNPKDPSLVQEITAIRDAAQKALRGEGFDQAFVSPEEFVAHALSDSVLQARLQEIPYTPKNSLWKSFKTALLKTLFQKEVPQNLLDATVAAADSIFAAPKIGGKPSAPGFAATAPRATPTYTTDPTLEARAADLVYTPPTIKTAVANAITAAKANYSDRIGIITKIRTHIPDKFATFERRLIKQMDGVRKAGSLRAAGVVIARQAEDVIKFLPAFFRRGGIRVDEVTGTLVTFDTAKNPEQIAPVLRTLAEKYGKTFEQVYAHASRIMEGRRLQAFIDENKHLSPDERKVLIHWRTPDGKIDYAGIKKAALEYDTYAEYEQLAEIMDEPRKGLMNELIKAGWVDQKTGAILRDVEFYVPFDRIKPDDVSKMFREIKRVGIRGLASVSKMPEFKGAFDMPVKNVFDSYFKTMGWLITELAKQNANTHMINDMVEAGYAKKLGFSREGAKTDYVVTLREKGEPVHYELQSNYDMVAFLDKSGRPRWYITAMSSITGFVRGLITYNPVFATAQVAMDTQGALILADVRNPALFVRACVGNFASLSWHETKNIWKNMTGQPTKRHKIEAFMEEHGMAGEIDYISRDPALDVLFEMGIRQRRTLGSTTLGAIVHGLKQITHSSDLAVRAALREDSMRTYNDELLADTKARELINFRRRGANSVITDLAAIVPFLNAHIQAMDILLREATGVGASITGQNRAVAKRQFVKMMGLYAAISTMYAIAKQGDEDYLKLTERARNRGWVFDNHVSIPIRSDLGMFKVFIENTVDYVARKGTPEERQATQAVFAVLSNVWESTAGSMVPIPPILRQLMENLWNRSFLTGRELVGKYQQTKLPHKQETGTTSETAKSMAAYLYEVTNGNVDISPVKIDNAINGIFGAVSATFMLAVDAMLNPDATDRPLHKMAVIGRFTWDDSQLTRPKDELYELMELVMPYRATYNDMRITDPENAQAFAIKHKKEIAVASVLVGLEPEMASLRKAVKYYDSPLAAKRLPKEERERLKQHAREQYNKLGGFVRKLRADLKI